MKNKLTKNTAKKERLQELMDMIRDAVRHGHFKVFDWAANKTIDESEDIGLNLDGLCIQLTVNYPEDEAEEEGEGPDGLTIDDIRHDGAYKDCRSHKVGKVVGFGDGDCVNLIDAAGQPFEAEVGELIDLSRH